MTTNVAVYKVHVSFRHAAALVFALLACVCACQDDQVVPRLISGRVQLPGGTPDAVVVSRIEWPESQYSPLAVKSGVFEIDQTSAQEGHLVTIDAKQNGVKMGYLITDGRHLLRPIHVTLLSEYASRRLDDFLEAVPTARFEFLQNRIAQALVQSDIDGDGIVDYRDILAFDPDDPAQVAKLSFDYHEVLDRKLACNCTLRDTYATPTDAHDIEARLSEVFDSIVDVDLPNAEGPASLASVFVDVDAGGSLTIDELPSVSLDSLNRQYFYRIEDDTQPTTLTLHATPAETYHFVRWVGCDEPHGDTCVVHASSSAPIVSAQFGLEEKVRDGVILVRLDAFEVGTVSILPTALGWQVLAKKDSPADKAFAAVQAGTLIATGRADMPLAKIGAVTTSRDDAAEGRVRYVFAVTEAPPWK